jgi:hypothetical protein
MAARTRRTRFAASFVAVVAGACSHDAQPTGNGTGTNAGTGNEPVHWNPPPVDPNPPPPAPADAAPAAPKKMANAWNISKKPDGTCEGFDDQCTVMDSTRNPSDPIPPCNPPPQRPFACPSGMTGDYAEIVTYDGTTCVEQQTQAPVECPSDAPPKAAFVGRRWSISAGAKDVCWAEPQVDCDPAVVHHTCNPPAPTKVKCPPYIAGQDVREVTQDKCVTRFVITGGHCPPHAHCNPPPPHDIDVPCP